jgi:hypothetical protein
MAGREKTCLLFGGGMIGDDESVDLPGSGSVDTLGEWCEL